MDQIHSKGNLQKLIFIHLERDFLHFWKGTKLRTFLMYAGIVIFKDHLPFDVYEHFVELFCAVRICSCNEYASDLKLAKALFREYVANYGLIYGPNQVVSNVHILFTYMMM